jgi:hypothetical protein
MRRLLGGCGIFLVTFVLTTLSGRSAHSGTKWSEEFLQKIGNSNDVLFLNQCKIDDRQKDVVIISLIRKEVDFLRIQDHDLLVVFGRFSIEDGALVASFEKRVGLRGFGGGQGRAEPGAANP